MHQKSAIPLVVHIIYRLDVGGLENGLVNLINHMSASKYRHAIICMTDYTDFRSRIRKPDVDCYALHKKEGHDWGLHFRLWRLLRKLKPAIVHTRNIGTLECAFTAKMAGVGARVHGEHGRDMSDIDGSNKKYLLLRKLMKPMLNRFIAVSKDLEAWLMDAAKFDKSSIVQIYNGVDDLKFHPHVGSKLPLPYKPFNTKNTIVLGAIGQLRGEKDQMNLCHAFKRLIDNDPNRRETLRLVLVGEGPKRPEIEAFLQDNQLTDIVWLAGARNDVPDIFRAMDIFILPSLGEGISNTVLEAMSSGLPVIATAVGGNPELVINGKTGFLVKPADPAGLSTMLEKYINEPELMAAHGEAGRNRIEKEFSMGSMVARYQAVYDDVLAI